MVASPFLSPGAQRRTSQLDASSRRIGAERDARNGAEDQPAAFDVVYASAVTGKGSLEARVQLGTVGLQVLRRGGAPFESWLSVRSGLYGLKGSALPPVRFRRLREAAHAVIAL